MCRSKRTQGTAAGRYGDGGKQLQQTHALESETSSSASEQQACTLFPVNSQVSVDGIPMTMELDTGAYISVISEHTYHSTWPHDRPALPLSPTKLRTYSGEELEVIGSISVQVCYEDQQEGTTPSSGSRYRCQPVGSELAGDTPAAADTCTSGNLKVVCRGI